MYIGVSPRCSGGILSLEALQPLQREELTRWFRARKKPKYPLTQRHSRVLCNGSVQESWKPLHSTWALPITKLSFVSIPCFGGTRWDQVMMSSTISTEGGPQAAQHRSRRPLRTLPSTLSFLPSLLCGTTARGFSGITAKVGTGPPSYVITWGTQGELNHHFSLHAPGQGAIWST